MPIFFHLESHLWIGYLFIFNGLLINYALASNEGHYRRLTESMEAKVVAAFIFSILMNGALLLVADIAGVTWRQVSAILPFISIFLIVNLIRQRYKAEYLVGELSLFRSCFYVFVFCVMFFNGGLIEQVSDAWWHMSMANKMSSVSSFDLDRGHLNGVSSRYYPPLWHANLAFAKLLSGESLPVLWNSFTAWGAMLKVMVFYLFSLSLSKNRLVASLACVLFFVLPGVGLSYARTSAWPSHIAYIGWFAMFYVVFRFLDQLSGETVRTLSGSLRLVFSLRVHIFILFFLGVFVLLTHQLELVWFFAAILAYLVSLEIIKGPWKGGEIEPDLILLTWGARIGLLVLLGLGGWLIVDSAVFFGDSLDLVVSYVLPIAVFIGLFVATLSIGKKVKFFIAVSTVAMVLLSINAQHFISLFLPEHALPAQGYRELPLLAVGYFGGVLQTAGWHLQLREAFLYGGLVAVLLSFVLVFIKPKRATIFLCANAVIGFAFCLSPYLFNWLRDVMAYHSSWRIAVLVFTPLIIAESLCLFARMALDNRAVLSNAKRGVAGLVCVGLVALTCVEVYPRFDRNVIDLKRQHKSAQRNWHLFYGQEYVFNDASLKYQNDFEEIIKIVQSDSVLLADISTSYYAAAYLPLFIVNTHRHHGKYMIPRWHSFLEARHGCYLDVPARRDQFKSFLVKERLRAEQKGASAIRYLMVNKDQINLNLKNDCLSQTRTAFIQNVDGIANLTFDGEYLMLFELR